jgi:NAD(P)-dependent dehydrogenase (short-subunit alcohol dehydrogenase family)/acyl dehydratase/putative sterol carrier protein
MSIASEDAGSPAPAVCIRILAPRIAPARQEIQHMGMFDGKVVIVTGAGGGLGRAHALMFAAEGAKVVVNDLGGTRDGSGEGTAMADQVVAEIVAAGGEGTPNYDNVATTDGGNSITKTALAAYGRIDILVNNAGILRDKSLIKMDESMWDAVMAVHTKQLFAVTQPVVRHMAQRAKDGDKGGAIINTTSLAGLLGNYGQTNYATAKAGAAGFTRTLALETRKMGVTVNAIAPVAKTRMTDDIDMVPDDMVPEQVSVMALFLASEAAKGITGRVFGVHGQQLFEYKMTMTPGVTKDGDDHWTPAEIGERFDEISRDESFASPAEDGETDEVTAAFAQIPAGLKVEAAGSWAATMHWVIKGGADQTLTIADGVCTHSEGLVGTPTCTVKTDKDTVVGMFSGKVDPTKAFMAGKITADNLPDMMKMGGAFDFQAIGAAIAAAQAGAPVDPVTEAFEALPYGFLADKAGDWSAVFHFAIAGGTDQTLTVGGGECRVEEGLVGTATCTIKTDKDTVIGMMNGSIDGTKAFMAGKITADNMGDMMKFASFFKLDEKAAAKAAAARGSAPAKAAPAAPPKEPVDLRKAIGRRYSADFVVANGDDMIAYARATNDENPRYTEGLDAAPILSTNVAPPIYPVRLFHPLMFQCVGDPDLDLDMLRLVHGEQDMTWHRPLRPGEIVNLRAILESVAQKSKGCVVAWRMLGLIDGLIVVEARMSVFVRGQRLPGVEPGTVFGQEPPKGDGTPEGEPTATSTMTVSADQPARYAAASLDDNPIHIDESVAKAAGHPSVILHGLCTMAFAAKGLVDEVLDGDSSRLKRLAVRFSKPVLPGWELTTRIYDAGPTDNGGHAYKIETVNQDGVPVITNGWAEVASA